MKRLLFLLSALPLLFFLGCKDDSADNPEFGEKDIPHIYVGWLYTMAYKTGDTIKIAPEISPSDGATYLWTLDNETIATTKDLEYALPDDLLGSFQLKFEVVRNGVFNSREATVLLSRDFVQKENKRKLVGWLTRNGTPDDVDWESITHLIVSSAIVKEDGTLDVNFPSAMNLPILRAFAHSYGVYLIMEVSGRIDYINSHTYYDDRSFYNPATTNPDGIIADIEKAMKDFGFDGVNIYMDKAIDVKYDNPEAVKVFYQKMGEKIKGSKNTIDGVEYDYILTMSVMGGWTKTALGNVVNLPAYDWINVLAFLDEDIVGVPRSHGTVAYANTEISNWLDWADCGPVTDPTRLVLVAPTAGIRYYGIPATYSWPTWEEFTEYIGYKDICSRFPEAPTKNPAIIVILDNYNNRNMPVDKIYYNGLKDMEDRVRNVVIPKNLGGIALWRLEDDAVNPDISLLKRIKKTLDEYE